MKIPIAFLTLILLFIITLESPAQTKRKRIDNWEDLGTFLTKDSITKGKYTLIFLNKDSAFQKDDKDLKRRMIKTFFKVYPKEAKAYHKETAKKVIFIIDPDYEGVAATSGAIVRYSPDYMLKFPKDIDVVTHEVFHIVQAYGYNAGAGWLTEGITDYIRYKYGVSNIAAKWTLPDYKASQSYTNSYRITARFLVWLEKNGYPTIVKDLDASLRARTYKTAETWSALTGKTVDELWKDYGKNPAVSLKYK
ncbi:MAG: basic secretory protein-like protein [Sphingobacteriaceae bacterium]